MNLTTLTSKDLAKITKLLKSKEALQARISKVDAQLTAFESGKPVAVAVVAKKKGMSAAGRAAVSAAQKARWAKTNKAKKAEKPVAKAKKFTMSAAAKAKISAARKEYWAKRNAEKAGKPAGAQKLSPVSEKLIAAMKDAGTKGVSVPDLAKKTGMKNANIKSWVKTTALKLGVKKISRGVYAL